MSGQSVTLGLLGILARGALPGPSCGIEPSGVTRFPVLHHMLIMTVSISVAPCEIRGE